MSELKLKKIQSKRIILAALVVAASVVVGALLHTADSENVALVWLTTAVYMLGPVLAALIVWPLVAYDGWLLLTAVVLSLAVVIPWAFINPSAWATSFLPQLGQWANVLFIVLLTTHVSAGRPPRFISWLLSGFYLLIVLGMPFLL